MVDHDVKSRPDFHPRSRDALAPLAGAARAEGYTEGYYPSERYPSNNMIPSFILNCKYLRTFEVLIRARETTLQNWERPG